MKIYSDDPLVPYKTTTISAERTKAEIDGILAEWQLSDYHWHWKPEQNDIYVQFLLEEKVEEVIIKVTVVSASLKLCLLQAKKRSS